MTVFRKFEVDSNTITVSECVKELGWGGNKLIRSGGIRISKELKLWKMWDVIKDPHTILKEDCYIGTNKGVKVVSVVFAELRG